MSATYEMTEWLQNCRFYQTIISNYLSEVKYNLNETYSNYKTCLLKNSV